MTRPVSADVIERAAYFMLGAVAAVLMMIGELR